MDHPTLTPLFEQMQRIIRGKDDALKHTIACLIAGGHLLVEDIPGVGKTTLAYALSKSIGGAFSRIQFTNDLLPSDILGVSIYQENQNGFEFHPGPIFANIVLADEINRTTPKTQSSLLECMERAQISTEGKTLDLPSPFMVVATQNPIDFEGTYPLPENQLDRFLMRISLGYPDLETEKEILKEREHHYDHLSVEPVMEPAEILSLRQQVSEVFIEESVLNYLLQWVEATRQHSLFRLGISTRGAIALKRVSQARALMEKRDYVIPNDVEQSIQPVFTHRIITQQTTNGANEERSIIENELIQIGKTIKKP